jgi:hypothetical protein
VFGLALSIVGLPAVAEDVAQEAFVRARDQGFELSQMRYGIYASVSGRRLPGVNVDPADDREVLNVEDWNPRLDPVHDRTRQPTLIPRCRLRR